MNDPAGANSDAPSSQFSWLPQSTDAAAETPFEEIARLDVRVTEAPPPAATFDSAGIASGGPQPDPPAVFSTGSAQVAAPAAPTYPTAVYPPPAAAYPISGPPGYPVSVPPISAAPYGYPIYPPPPAPKSRRAAVIVLTLLTALLTAATGVMTTLYLLKADEAQQLSHKVSTHESTISTQRHDLEGLNREVDDVKRQLAGAQDESSQLTTAKDSIAKCLTTIYDFWDLLDANKTAEAKQKADEVDQVCGEADKYL